jgi:hypothetical protein
MSSRDMRRSASWSSGVLVLCLISSLTASVYANEPTYYEINAKIARTSPTKAVAGSVPMPGYPDRWPAYELTVHIKNVGKKNLKFSFMNIITYATDGDALNIVCHKYAPESVPYVIEPTHVISFRVSTDGYTPSLTRTGGSLNLAIALTEKIFTGGPISFERLPKLAALPEASSDKTNTFRFLQVRKRGNLDLLHGRSERTASRSDIWLIATTEPSGAVTEDVGVRDTWIKKRYGTYQCSYLYYENK